MASKTPIRTSKDLSVMTIQGGTRDTAGAYTWAGSALSVTGHFRGAGSSLEARSEEISSDAEPLEIDWNISDGLRGHLDVYEINAADPQPLLTLVLSYDWLKIVRTVAAGGSTKTETLIHSRGTYTRNASGKAEVQCSIALGSAGAAPTYA